jgi:hypothetical protein
VIIAMLANAATAPSATVAAKTPKH